MPALMRYAKTEQESKPIVAKRAPTENIAFVQLPPCNSRTEEILSELGDGAKRELADIFDHAKEINVKLTSFGLVYDRDYRKYGIFVSYEGQQNERLKTRTKTFMRIITLNQYLEKSKIFDSIGAA
jgi:hypothetical protein